MNFSREALVEAMVKDSPNPEFTRKCLTQPKGRDFKLTLKRLPVEMAEQEPQVHVTLKYLGDLSVAWDQLAAKCHHNDLKPLGYIEHTIMHEGKRLRVVRIILAE